MGKTKILVVDDDEAICISTQKLLTLQDYQVFAASDAEEAITVTKKELPQIILLDIKLGQVWGLDILSQLKEIDKGVKVIMLTALEDADCIQKAKSLGADDYIAKPFNAEYLNQKILQSISLLSLQQKKLAKEKKD